MEDIVQISLLTLRAWASLPQKDRDKLLAHYFRWLAATKDEEKF